MKDTRITIRKKDLEIILAKFYRLVDVSIETIGYEVVEGGFESLDIAANYPKKRRKK